MVKIYGMIGEKKYKSRSFSDDAIARQFAYKKVFKKDGNTRRKNPLHSFYIE